MSPPTAPAARSKRTLSFSRSRLSSSNCCVKKFRAESDDEEESRVEEEVVPVGSEAVTDVSVVVELTVGGEVVELTDTGARTTMGGEVGARGAAGDQSTTSSPWPWIATRQINSRMRMCRSLFIG